MSRADLTKAPAEVAAMFDDVAERYDITNDVLALGRTRVWRRAVVDAVDPKPGQFILDLAAGTGTSSVPFAQAGATVVPTDFSLGMLQVGRRRQPRLPSLPVMACICRFEPGCSMRRQSPVACEISTIVPWGSPSFAGSYARAAVSSSASSRSRPCRLFAPSTPSTS